jgi:eukaryotic-like serine/threonine-protein kinase
MLKKGTILEDRYRISRVLGEGGYGITAVARDLEIDVDVAIKLQQPRTLHTTGAFSEITEDFNSEAEVLKQINIRGIPRYHRTGEHRGHFFMVVDLVQGITLSQFIEDNGTTLDFVTAAAIGRLCEILTQLHGLNWVHRDIKPDNIMIDDSGEVLLLDLGLAERIGPRCIPYPTGTPGYAAPEQYRPENPTSVLMDIFALGCVLLEMATMVRPYADFPGLPDPDAAPYPPGVLDRMGPQLRELGLAMVNLGPSERPASAAEVLDRLRPVLPRAGDAWDPRTPRPDVTAWYRRPRRGR